uniref:Uncharacterized protein n=1 Tax=Tanacetum cinerariifolium TaxID=118510 RepID=A0A6L2NT05_TANCI|nr:hypothetical protein [Tanacetum cinerariifolium]
MKRESRGFSRVETTLFPTILVNEQLSQGEGPTSPVGTQHTPIVIKTSLQLQNISNTYGKTRTKTRSIGIRIPQSNVPSSVADEASTKEMHDELGKATTTTSSLEAEQGSESKMLFNITMESAKKFVPMESEGQIKDFKIGEGSSKKGKSLNRPAKEDLGQEQQKKQKVKEDLSQERLQQMMVIISEQGIHVEALQTKFCSLNPIEEKEISLWIELKRLFKPDEDDELWKFESFMLTWRLYDWCAVHHISIRDGQDIFMIVEKEYPLSKGALLMIKTKNVKCLEESSEYRRFNLRNLKIWREIISLGEDCWELIIYILSTAKTEVSTANTILVLVKVIQEMVKCVSTASVKLLLPVLT